MSVLNDTSLAIVLTLLAWVPFPCGLHTFLISTLNDADLDPDDQIFTFIAELNRIPGLTGRIDILLPTTGANPPPANQAAANSRVLIRPLCGPTASNGLLANQQLDVNFDPANVIEYDAAEFIYTWLSLPDSPLNGELIWMYMTQLAEILGRQREMLSACELAAKLTFRYPAMQVQVAGVPFIPDENTELMDRAKMYNSTAVTQLTADLPTNPGDRWDMMLDSPSQVVWNKVMMDCATLDPDGGYLPLTYWGGAGEYLISRAMWVCRSYAAMWDELWVIHGYPISVWNSIFGQGTYQGLRQYMRRWFARSVSSGTDAIYSPKFKYFSYLYRALFDSDPASDLWDVSFDARINIPNQSLVAAYNEAGDSFTDIVPGCLNDYWRHDIRPAAVGSAPFLPPLSRMVGIVSDKMRVIPLNGPFDASVPVPIERHMRSLGIDTIPLNSDDCLWNSRVVWHAFDSTIYTTDGAAFAGNVPAGTNIVTQRAITLDYTLPNITQARVVTAKTDWIPVMAPDGRYVVVGVPAANGASFMTQVMCGRAFVVIETFLGNNLAAVPSLILGVDAAHDPFPEEGGEEFDQELGNSLPPSAGDMEPMGGDMD